MDTKFLLDNYQGSIYHRFMVILSVGNLTYLMSGYSSLTACKIPIKSGQIGFLLQEDAQCSETYEIIFSDF